MSPNILSIIVKEYPDGSFLLREDEDSQRVWHMSPLLHRQNFGSLGLPRGADSMCVWRKKNENKKTRNESHRTQNTPFYCYLLGSWPIAPFLLYSSLLHYPFPYVLCCTYVFQQLGTSPAFSAISSWTLAVVLLLIYFICSPSVQRQMLSRLWDLSCDLKRLGIEPKII